MLQKRVSHSPSTEDDHFPATAAAAASAKAIVGIARAPRLCLVYRQLILGALTIVLMPSMPKLFARSSQMLDLGRQMETELHSGALIPSTSNASPALGVAGTGGSKGARSRTAGAATMGSEAQGRGAGAGAEAADGGKNHSGMLSETDETRTRSRGAKVGSRMQEVVPLRRFGVRGRLGSCRTSRRGSKSFLYQIRFCSA